MSSLGSQIMRAGQQRAMRGHEQAVHVEDGQHVQQHVVGAPAPVLVQHARVGREVAVRQHGALLRPVVPDVYRMAARSSSRRATVSKRCDRPPAASSSVPLRSSSSV